MGGANACDDLGRLHEAEVVFWLRFAARFTATGAARPAGRASRGRPESELDAIEVQVAEWKPVTR
ncbi:MAG: hypothetical protein LW806_03505 [Planctomycetaceae bacterium]|jgi:hypothetical protein|nr:hypothetical protein [Planctomycetaceae bacterium]